MDLEDDQQGQVQVTCFYTYSGACWQIDEFSERVP